MSNEGLSLLWALHINSSLVGLCSIHTGFDSSDMPLLDEGLEDVRSRPRIDIRGMRTMHIEFRLTQIYGDNPNT